MPLGQSKVMSINLFLKPTTIKPDNPKSKSWLQRVKINLDYDSRLDLSVELILDHERINHVIIFQLHIEVLSYDTSRHVTTTDHNSYSDIYCIRTLSYISGL